MRVVDEEGGSDGSQSAVGGIEERVGGLVVLRSDPFALEHAPERLRDVELRRVRREIEQEKVPFLPDRPHLPDDFAAVYAGVVEHDDGLPRPVPHGQPVEEVRQLGGVYALPRREAFVAVVPGGHPEYVEAAPFLRRHADVLSGELPSVGDVAFGADVALVGVVEVCLPVISFFFKFLQLPGLVLVELRRGLSPWAFPYTLISCANADKKRLNVDSLASLPLARCHASRALFTLCLSCSIARRTASSSEQSIIGLRPLPGRVSSPLMPSALYLTTQRLTAFRPISVRPPTASKVMPPALRSTARQRIL